MKFIQIADTSLTFNYQVGFGRYQENHQGTALAESTEMLIGATMSGTMKSNLDTNQRSCSFGDVVVSIARVTPSFEDCATVFVGSDEGLTAETLSRIAELIAELMRFLGFSGGHESWAKQKTPNLNTPLLTYLTSNQAQILRRVVNYCYHQMDTENLSFFLNAITRQRLIVYDVNLVDLATYGNTLDALVCGLRKVYDGDQGEDTKYHVDCPGYGCAVFADRLVEETGEPTLKKSLSLDDTQIKYRPTATDRRLIQLIVQACGFPAIPLRTASKVEETICRAEQTLWDFGIKRDNVLNCPDLRESLEEFLEHLIVEDGSDEAKSRAETIRAAFDALRANVERLRRATDVQFDEGDSLLVPPHLHPLFRRNDIPELQEGEEVQHCPVWLGCPPDFPSTDALLKAQIPVGFLEVLRVPMLDDETTIEAWSGLPMKPCDIGLLMMPRNPDENFSPWVKGGVMERAFRLDYQQRMAWDSYLNDYSCYYPTFDGDVKGLVYYCFVDRSTNTSACCNPVALAASIRKQSSTPKPEDIQTTQSMVGIIHRMMLQGISRSHALTAKGYQEGLWGHLGFQFYFKIGVADIGKGAATAAQTGAGSQVMPANCAPLDLAHYENFVRRPHRLADLNDKALTELYCIFAGAVPPEEVVAGGVLLAKLVTERMRQVATERQERGKRSG